MTYQGYVVGAYCIFAAVLAWDFVAPRLQLRQQLRAATSRAAKLHAATLHDARDPSRTGPLESNR